MAQNIGQHKAMAMGKGIQTPVKGGKFAKGGPVKGVPLSPITESKRENGIPGIKKGGKC